MSSLARCCQPQLPANVEGGAAAHIRGRIFWEAAMWGFTRSTPPPFSLKAALWIWVDNSDPRLEHWVSGVCAERGHLMVGNPLRKTLYCYHTKCSPLVPSQAGDYASLPCAQNAHRHPRRKWLLLNTDSEDSVTCHPPPPGVRPLSALFHQQQRAALRCTAWPCREIEACLSPRNSQLYSWDLKYPKVLGEEQGVCSFPNHMDVNWVRH